MTTVNPTSRMLRRIHPRAITRYGFILGMFMIVIALLWTGLIQGRDLREWFPAAGWLSDLMVGSAAGAAFGLVAWRLLDRVPPLKQVEQMILTSLDMDAMRYYHAALFGLLAGIPEEILFRGAVQPVLGIVIAAAIFGAFHAINLAYFLYAAGAGVLLGLLANGGLWAPIAAHTVIDTMMFALLIRRWRHLRACSPAPLQTPLETCSPASTEPAEVE